jgi:LAS superfamily LD-carboxypeptidase LdcB
LAPLSIADALDPYLALKAAAARDGIELKIVSGFRDFDAQLRIWNMNTGESVRYTTQRATFALMPTWILPS